MIESARTLTELLSQTYHQLMKLYEGVAKAAPGNVDTDLGIMKDLEYLEQLVIQLEGGFINKLQNDERMNAKDFSQLQKLEEILERMSTRAKELMDSEHKVHELSDRIKKGVGKLKRNAKKEGERNLRALAGKRRKAEEEAKRSRAK